MFIKFRSDSRYTRQGFEAQWSTSQGCYQNLTGNQGTLQSPNYPNYYYFGADCVWKITTDPGTHVRLTFSAMSIYRTSGCTSDSVVIGDGNNSTNILGRVCGYEVPVPFIATGNVMTVEFSSRASSTRRGFQARWSTNQGLDSFTNPLPLHIFVKI
ncbi:Tolloid-like protein 1 [Elysia marginata]|uniref:Tolloid-like protein 1 n=1 Tax=Elysia marginata TaxID=1093978 RepID=A0AAV4HJ29_9GAST|nr:Tolloid-like protein 1 [Elysia marginata]